MSADPLLASLDDAASYAAFQLQGEHYPLGGLDALCAWTLACKGARKLSLRDTHLVWGDGPLEQRTTITLELRAGEAVESWRLVTAGEDAAAVLAALKAARATRREAA